MGGVSLAKTLSKENENSEKRRKEKRKDEGKKGKEGKTDAAPEASLAERLKVTTHE